MMHSLLKSTIVDFHRGRDEALSMDDELPILILITAKAEYPNLIADINLIEDLIQSDENVCPEERLLTNLRVIIVN